MCCYLPLYCQAINNDAKQMMQGAWERIFYRRRRVASDLTVSLLAVYWGRPCALPFASTLQ